MTGRNSVERHFLPDECDIAIVGAGASGAILAAHLSAKPGRRVVLIEAGPDTPPDAVPADIRDPFPLAYSNPHYFWPGLRAQSRQGDEEKSFLQARVMGGGSSVMGMWGLRGSPRDYDLWREAGAVGWAWDDVLPAFNRIERDLDYDGALHGSDGPIPLRRFPPEVWPGFVRSLARAADAQGLSLRGDINGDFGDGVFPVPVTNDHSGRASSASGFLTPAVRARANLLILSDTFAKRLVFNENREVTAVEYSRLGMAGRMRSARVFLAAGAIGTPALLLRSGIGPARELKALGIDPIADLPGVGEGLQNHCIVNFATRIAPAARQRRDLRSYALACARLSSRHRDGRQGDLHLQFIAKTSLHPHGDRIGLVGAALYAPLSRGKVSLRSADNASPPLIQFRLLEHPSDRARLAEVSRRAMDLLGDEQVRATRDDVFTILPSSIVRRLNRPGAINCGMSAILAGALDMPPIIRRQVLKSAGALIPEQRLASLSGEDVLDFASPIFHPTGSCAIGRAEDPLAVLDPLCRVRRIVGVHVADASIMPVIPTGNTCLPAMMIAEHLSRRVAAENLC